MINMFFGKQTCLKQYIQDRIIKDYDLPEVTDITNTDYIVIFDENDSRKISLSNIINNTVDKNKPAVVTVIKSDGSKLTMFEAIEAIPDNRKKLGLIVTYNDVDAGWSLIQYTADNLTTFSNINNWKTISTDIATETINNSIKELDDKLVSYYQEHHSDILSLEDKNEHLKQDFNVHVSKTSTQFSNIDSNLKETQEAIDSINIAIDGLSESTQGLSEALTKLRTQFNSVAKRTDDLDNIVDTLDDSVSTLGNSVSELQRDLTNTSHKCDDIMNLLPTYYSKITALETWKTSTDERLNDMAETLANLDTRLTRLERLNRVETE